MVFLLHDQTYDFKLKNVINTWKIIPKMPLKDSLFEAQ